MTTDERSTSNDVALALDVAHQKSRDAYQSRDLSAYLASFTPDLVYRSANGHAYSREQLGRQVHAQLRNLVAADTRFSRESLVVDDSQAIETGTQAARAAIRVGFIFARRWTIHRRCKLMWRRTAAGWLIAAVDVLEERIQGDGFGLAKSATRGAAV
jgi:ketosteroid isomerase-like protein